MSKIRIILGNTGRAKEIAAEGFSGGACAPVIQKFVDAFSDPKKPDSIHIEDTYEMHMKTSNSQMEKEEL